MSPVELAVAGVLVVLAAGALLAWRVLQGLRAGAHEIAVRLAVLRGEPGAFEWARAGLAPSLPAPQFELPTLAGARATLDGLRADRRAVVLTFTAMGCRASERIDPQLRRFAEATRGAVTTATLISVPAAAATATLVGGDAHTLLDAEGRVAADYLVERTPSAVLIDPQGRIGSPLAGGAEAVRELHSMVATAAGMPDGALLMQSAIVGSPLPPFSVVELPTDGRESRATAVVHEPGVPLLVLILSPACRHSMRLVPALRVWETTRPESDQEVVIISRGNQQANDLLRLASPIVGDPYGRSFAAYDVPGTPSAIRTRVDGIVDAVAVGTAEITELLGLLPDAPDETVDTARDLTLAAR